MAAVAPRFSELEKRLLLRPAIMPAGRLGKILDEINRRHRVQPGRNPDPSYGIIDSQSVKTVSSGDQRGFDGEKR